MKKNKKTLYLLIIVVAIYAAIIVRFFMSDSGGDLGNRQQSINMSFVPESFIAAKEFTIVNDYRDPFLSSGRLPRKNLKKPNTSIKKNREVKDSIVFPQIEYKGLVSDTNGKEKIFALAVENKEYVITQGSVVDSVKILSGSPTEIVLRFRSKERIFKVQ